MLPSLSVRLSSAPSLSVLCSVCLGFAACLSYLSCFLSVCLCCAPWPSVLLSSAPWLLSVLCSLSVCLCCAPCLLCWLFTSCPVHLLPLPGLGASLCMQSPWGHPSPPPWKPSPHGLPLGGKLRWGVPSTGQRLSHHTPCHSLHLGCLGNCILCQPLTQEREHVCGSQFPEGSVFLEDSIPVQPEGWRGRPSSACLAPGVPVPVPAGHGEKGACGLGGF